MKIRSHLFILTVGTLLPLFAFAAITAIVLAQRERATFQRGATERTLALITAVDAELSNPITTLDALATSRHLDDGNLRAFYEEITRFLESQPNWSTISLALPSGRQVANPRRPLGDALPAIQDAPSFDKVLKSGAPAVSDLVRSQLTRQIEFAVRVPVMRGGEVKYVLSATVKPQSMSQLLSLQRLPPDWIGVILDGNKRFVARTVGTERVLGEPASESLQAALSRSPEGWFQGTTIEHTAVYTAYNRSPTSGWTVAIGIPAPAVEAAARRSVWAMGAGILVALAVAFALALMLGRRISAPIVALAAGAKAIGRGEQPQMPGTTRVEEVEELARALEEAGSAVRAREEGERQARVEAQAANRTKDEFLAVLSHELRTPLNAVYGWARMLQSEQFDEDKKAHALDVIMRNANAQVQLIDDLLDVSRIVTGKMRLDVRVVDLHAVIGNALDAVRPAAQAKDLRLQPVLDPRAVGVTGDPDRLQQVVWNLLNNAVKFTPRNGRIWVHLERINSHVEIIIGDTGQGISEEALPHIFERFRQVDSTSTRATAGLGLGLALVRHLVEAHGGTVTADSAGIGKGTTFTVKLPVAAAPAQEPDGRVLPAARIAPMERLSGPSLQDVRVLAVDDDRDSLELMSAILIQAGGELRVAASAAEGFRLLQQWLPDVLISDIEMPGEDGYAFIMKVRGLEPSRGGKTPAIALTGYGRIEDRVRTLSAGFSMHVPKPVDPTELVTIVASLADRSPARAKEDASPIPES